MQLLTFAPDPLPLTSRHLSTPFPHTTHTQPTHTPHTVKRFKKQPMDLRGLRTQINTPTFHMLHTLTSTLRMASVQVPEGVQMLPLLPPNCPHTPHTLSHSPALCAWPVSRYPRALGVTDSTCAMLRALVTPMLPTSIASQTGTCAPMARGSQPEGHTLWGGYGGWGVGAGNEWLLMHHILMAAAHPLWGGSGEEKGCAGECERV